MPDTMPIDTRASPPGAAPAAMPFARLLPAVLALLLLAAHFYRAGQLVLAALAAVFAVLPFVRHRTAGLIVQVALALGAFEWVRTTFAFAGARVAQGGPVLRLVLILGTVVAFTLFAAWLLGTKPAQRWRESRRAD
jgi:hypothetical protein